MAEEKPEIFEETPDPVKPLSSRQSYNLASDTLVGVNVRGKDNIYQGIAILACLAIGALIGTFVVDAKIRLIGAGAGAFIGMIVGLFGSGIFLMIYRAVQHFRGKHD
jgi:hypothetical protein